MDRKMAVPVVLNDSIPVDLTFDTGAPLGYLSLDSAFCAERFSPARNVSPVASGHAPAIGWSYEASWFASYLISAQINIGKIKNIYDGFSVRNWKKILYNDQANGTFNIPANDVTWVWELNFEHNYLAIHQAKDFTFSENCRFLPFADSPYAVRIPLEIKTADGDTLTMNPTFLVDTAMPWDMMCVYPADELSFFEGKEAVWTCHANSYHRRYTVTAQMSEDIVLDSLRIYTLDQSYLLGVQYLIGLNFLKRFNVFFDMQNRRLGL